MLTRVPVMLSLALVWLSPALARAQVAAPPQAQEAPAVAAAAIDKIFERWDRNSSAGCAVGVSQGGQVVHARGYGMANLEYGIRNWPTTVFESGSVAKQFTAAAIALLAQDGKLSIDDPVRKYVPEAPGLRHADSHPAPPDPHERAPQPVAHAHAGRPSAGVSGSHGRRRFSNSSATTRS